jgi:hypothetical protein
MVVPKNMGVISKSMADRILQLKPEHLEFALRGQVEAITIQGATQRLKKMQNTIIKSREKLSKDPKEISAPGDNLVNILVGVGGIAAAAAVLIFPEFR